MGLGLYVFVDIPEASPHTHKLAHSPLIYDKTIAIVYSVTYIKSSNFTGQQCQVNSITKTRDSV